MNAAHATGTSPLLRLNDKNTTLTFLIDTGAALSVLPAGRSDRFKKGDVTLRAANNSIINTYGSVNPRFRPPTPTSLEIFSS